MVTINLLRIIVTLVLGVGPGTREAETGDRKGTERNG